MLTVCWWTCVPKAGCHGSDDDVSVCPWNLSHNQSGQTLWLCCLFSAVCWVLLSPCLFMLSSLVSACGRPLLPLTCSISIHQHSHSFLLSPLQQSVCHFHFISSFIWTFSSLLQLHVLWTSPVWFVTHCLSVWIKQHIFTPLFGENTMINFRAVFCFFCVVASSRGKRSALEKLFALPRVQWV